MKNVFGLLKILSLTAVSGAVGAGVIFAALDSDDLVGAAAGKKIAKKKKTSNVWNEVANELANTPAPNIPVAQPTPGLNPNGNLQVQLPDEPLQDPRDPELCAQNVLTQDNGRFTRTLIKGEVRGYHQEIDEDVTLCEIEIYPRGCDRSYTFHVQGDDFIGDQKTGAIEQMTCQSLATQYLSRKQVFLEVISKELDYGVGGKIRKDVIQSVSLANRSMDEFVERVTRYDNRRQTREQNRAVQSAQRIVNGIFK